MKNEIKAPSLPAYRPALLHGGYGAEVAQARHMVLSADARAKASDEMVHVSAYHAGGSFSEHRPYAFRDGVAIIGVRGYLMDDYPWIGDRWATGYDGLRFQADEAFADPDVKGVVLDIKSYGGYVAACFDLCDHLHALKVSTGKPVAAILSEYAYSAAYAIASIADSISVPRTGGVGSIGVICEHWNMAGALEKWGEEVTVVTSGAHKGDGNPYGPLPDSVRADLQADLDATRLLFAETVVRGRVAAGVTLTVEDVLATEARSYDGPLMTAKAVELGLADAVLAPSDAFAAFVAAINSNED
tara:strand:- start:19560 stop:20462 length:903 start_codon:yes stop_codon:yes gene_type:complete